MKQRTNIDDWLKRSTKASNVPLKVTDHATIAALQVLISVARRTLALSAKTSLDRTKRQ